MTNNTKVRVGDHVALLYSQYLLLLPMGLELDDSMKVAVSIGTLQVCDEYGSMIASINTMKEEDAK